MKALIICRESGDWRLIGRTDRSLRAVGITEISVARFESHLGDLIVSLADPVVIAIAGAWLRSDRSFRQPASSASGRPLMGIGAIRAPIGGAVSGQDAVKSWSHCLRRCGGDLDRRPLFARSLPDIVTCYLEPAAAVLLADRLREGIPLHRALNDVARSRTIRTVHLPSLDASFDPRIRSIQLLTTLQIGGAERVALDLADESRRQGFASAVAVFGAPRREAFPDPPDVADLSHVSSDANARADAVAKLACEYGADVVHAHLIRATEMAAIKARGIPLVVTLHNMPNGWPADIGDHNGEVADLGIACCRAVEIAAKRHGLPFPIRTVWNGIDPARYLPDRLSPDSRRTLREAFGIEETAFLIVVVANPRRQKRLDRVPAIVRATQRMMASRPVHALFVGATPASDDAMAAHEDLQRAIDTHGARDLIHWTGAMQDVRRALAAGDVLLSTSDYEGLSLALLEALAAGLPVVATAVGGNAELARDASQFHLLDVDAPPEEFAGILMKIANDEVPRVPRLPSSFARYRMTRRYLEQYATAINRSRSEGAKPKGVWLITNNFSTGGAQTSARRLLLAMKDAGLAVRAAVIQEDPRSPTPGRSSLLKAGIKVVATMPPEQIEAEDAVSVLLDAIFEDPPEAVLFWNLITSYKVLLADRLAGYRIVDVSPGEMFFDSMAQYFSSPRPGVPYRTGSEYGENLFAAVVKYQAESNRAEATLGCKIAVIPNGVPVVQSTKRRTSERLILGTAARLAPQKRLEDLLEALRLAHPNMPPYELRIAGAPERGTERYARSLRKLGWGLPIQWCGEVTAMGDFLSDLDVFVMISEPSGCPNASLEALAHGIPVIATAVGGACEQIEDRVTGRLVPPRDASALATALIEIARSPHQRRALGRAGLDSVRHRFGMSQMLTAYLSVLGLDVPEIPGDFSHGASIEPGWTRLPVG